MRDGLAVALAVAVITALTYYVFPGHTYLQQDTQIYAPMLDQLADPSLFTRELLTSRPHLAWTLYDEITLALRRVTRLEFAAVLAAQQWLFRALGIWGIYLIASSLGFARRLSLFVAALFSLGATIAGPAVLTIEYEPVPRGFALPLVYCALGLSLHRRWIAASAAASAALLYHAPTTIPFWIVFAALLWTARRWRPLLIPSAAVAILIVCSRLQPGVVERQPLFSIISPALQQLQRLRAPYNWISMWPAETIAHYAILCIVIAAAMRRLSPRLATEHRVVFWGLPLIGILSIPFSWLTLEVVHWSLIPQLQPLRAVLFITAAAIVLATAAAIQAAYDARYIETTAWFLVPFLIPLHKIVTPPYTLKEAGLVVFLALAATGATAVYIIAPRRSAPALAMAALAAFFAIPLVAGVRNYPALWNPQILELARWARESSPRDAVFLFPSAGKDLHPGLFRAVAQRAVYVDWKGGGQVNYFEDLAQEWWNRWQSTILRSAPDSDLAARGVDYIVLPPAESRTGSAPVYRNPGYAVYRISP